MRKAIALPTVLLLRPYIIDIEIVNMYLPKIPFHQRGHREEQWTHENMFNIASHKERANQNHRDGSHHTTYDEY